MPRYIALTYTRDVDWSHPDQGAEMAEYGAFSQAAAAVIRGGGVLYPTATATTVRANGGKGGDTLSGAVGRCPDPRRDRARGWALRRSPDQPDAYAVQAAIAACHALAPSYDRTDWNAVISWYDVLLTIDSGPAAQLGRASAIAERDGAAAGLPEVEGIAGPATHPWWHASRAELLHRLGRDIEAAQARDDAVRTGLTAPHIRTLDESLARRPRRP